MSDLIDREAVMEIILMPQNVSITEQLEMLKKLPSAEPKKGKWVQTNLPERSDNIVCDQCGYNSIAEFIYCPNCGAKMEVTE